MSHHRRRIIISRTKMTAASKCFHEFERNPTVFQGNLQQPKSTLIYTDSPEDKCVTKDTNRKSLSIAKTMKWLRLTMQKARTMHKGQKGEYLLTPEHSGEALRVAMHRRSCTCVLLVHVEGMRERERGRGEEE